MFVFHSWEREKEKAGDDYGHAYESSYIVFVNSPQKRSCWYFLFVSEPWIISRFDLIDLLFSSFDIKKLIDQLFFHLIGRISSKYSTARRDESSSWWKQGLNVTKTKLWGKEQTVERLRCQTFCLFDICNERILQASFTFNHLVGSNFQN